MIAVKVAREVLCFASTRYPACTQTAKWQSCRSIGGLLFTKLPHRHLLKSQHLPQVCTQKARVCRKHRPPWKILRSAAAHSLPRLCRPGASSVCSVSAARLLRYLEFSCCFSIWSESKVSASIGIDIEHHCRHAFSGSGNWTHIWTMAADSMANALQSSRVPFLQTKELVQLSFGTTRTGNPRISPVAGESLTESHSGNLLLARKRSHGSEDRLLHSVFRRSIAKHSGTSRWNKSKTVRASEH